MTFIVWQYWEQIGNSPRPNYVDLFVNLNYQILTSNSDIDFEHRFLTPESPEISHFFDLTVFKQLLPQQRADIIRIYLLNTFGGIWLDCDVFIYNISFFKSLIKRISLKYTFYSPRSCVRRLPSNWFIFSQRQSRISTILLDKLYALLESDSLHDIPYTYFGSLLFLSSMKEFGLYYNFPFDFFFFQRLPYYVSNLYFTTSPFSSLLFPHCLSPLVNISASSFNRDYLNRMISYELMHAHGPLSSSTLLSRLFRSSSSQIL